MPPLPQAADAGESEVVPAPPLADNGPFDRQQWNDFCRKSGLAAVAGAREGPSIDDLRLGELFARDLDIDDSGTIDRAEVGTAARSLAKHDRNEDENLTWDELLDGAPAGSPSVPTAAAKRRPMWPTIAESILSRPRQFHQPPTR